MHRPLSWRPRCRSRCRPCRTGMNRASPTGLGLTVTVAITMPAASIAEGGAKAPTISSILQVGVIAMAVIWDDMTGASALCGGLSRRPCAFITAYISGRLAGTRIAGRSANFFRYSFSRGNTGLKTTRRSDWRIRRRAPFGCATATTPAHRSEQRRGRSSRLRHLLLGRERSGDRTVRRRSP